MTKSELVALRKELASIVKEIQSAWVEYSQAKVKLRDLRTELASKEDIYIKARWEFLNEELREEAPGDVHIPEEIKYEVLK